MQKFKKIIVIILTLILINLIILLTISCNMKNILINGVIKETIKTQIETKTYHEGNIINNIDIEESELKELIKDERIKEILDSKEIQDLIDKYLDILTEGLIDDKQLDDIDIEHDLYEFLKENKNVLEEKIGIEITPEMIENVRKQTESKEYSRIIKESIVNTKKTLPKQTTTVIKGYKLLISLKFKLIIISLIILDIISIALLQKSTYKWIKNLSTSLIVSGILIITMSIIVKLIVSYISILKSFHMMSMFICGIILLLVGIIMLITYNYFIKRGDKNDLS